MKIRYFDFYLLFLVVTGAFWFLGYRSDQRLRAIYAKPDPDFTPRSIESAKVELKESYATQRDLVEAVHEMQTINTKMAVFAALLTFPVLLTAVRASRKQPIQPPVPTRGSGT
jgi:hypothetical protein